MRGVGVALVYADESQRGQALAYDTWNVGDLTDGEIQALVGRVGDLVQEFLEEVSWRKAIVEARKEPPSKLVKVSHTEPAMFALVQGERDTRERYKLTDFEVGTLCDRGRERALRVKGTAKVILVSEFEWLMLRSEGSKM